MKRKVGYSWRLREVIATHGIFTATELVPLLKERYAQPVSRIVRLTIDDVIQDHDQVLIRLGDSPSPVPQPFAALLLDYAAHRANMHTATNPGSTWLFPGRRARPSWPRRPERPGAATPPVITHRNNRRELATGEYAISPVSATPSFMVWLALPQRCSRPQ